MKITDSVSSVLNSASKIVFIIVAITVCAGFLLKVLEPKDFIVLASIVFTYYFTYKPVTPANDLSVPPAAVK